MNYTPLSALDRSFLDIEDGQAHMHVGATCIYESGPLRTAGGGIDIERIRRFVEGKLQQLPRYRQRLRRTPIGGHPVWVDDAHFYLPYHVRHAGLPRPGDERKLKRLAGRIFSTELDRGKPLWEMWVVEGLDRGERFAVIHKVHHCMVDGLAGADMMAVFNGFDAAAEDTPAPPPWVPRPSPSHGELLRDRVWAGLELPGKIASGLWNTLKDGPISVLSKGADLATTLQELAVGITTTAPPTPLNLPIGAHRRLDWLAVELAEVKAVKTALGGTVNDVVLATVTGGVARFLRRRGVTHSEQLGNDFRIFCPVGLPAVGTGVRIGNHVAGLTVDVPLGAVRSALVSDDRGRAYGGVEALAVGQGRAAVGVRCR